MVDGLAGFAVRVSVRVALVPHPFTDATETVPDWKDALKSRLTDEVPWPPAMEMPEEVLQV